ncbi:MAG: GNAT family N-acetyltransferase [Alphaproteobacteria bacterium]
MNPDAPLLKCPASIPAAPIRLALLQEQNAPALHALTNDPAIAGIISFLSYPVERRVIDDWIGRNAGDQDRVYGIFSGDVLMGQLGVHLTADPEEIEIGYWIGTAFWGRGAASRAVAAVTGMLADALPDHTIIAECLPGNHASLRVLEKSGFRAAPKPGHRPNRIKLVYRP